VARRLIPSDEQEDSYSEPHPAEQEQVAQLLREGGRGFTRKKLIGGAAVAAGGALGAAALAPALSLGPALDTESLYDSPWRRGRRLVDSGGRPYSADDIEPGAFYTAYPAGARRDEIAAPVVVVRLAPALLDLPPERRDWAPEGIVAYSKICTHAGCAIALYRSPKFDPTQPDAALMCPCHYSTFDPATGGTVLFGPAGRPLPQLPLQIGRGRSLRAAGDFSGPVGPSWSGVRSRGPR
jgi:quinol---cytochrome c reductase iron-sulfur subunit